MKTSFFGKQYEFYFDRSSYLSFVKGDQSFLFTSQKFTKKRKEDVRTRKTSPVPPQEVKNILRQQ